MMLSPRCGSAVGLQVVCPFESIMWKDTRSHPGMPIPAASLAGREAPPVIVKPLGTKKPSGPVTRYPAGIRTAIGVCGEPYVTAF